ncbi:hypothetical protein WICPIJ_000519 [Wickerhamomyces pijperi]|uniref:Uncharacterized protein n=1 Tax=Wickerhamomyces pijperi TaxID=599730 RepID=A0A9P8QDL0_WICPI|nr:hypothetical protein WICPIJ_000519 [Wickerhamomyces pijperi]
MSSFFHPSDSLSRRRRKTRRLIDLTEIFGSILANPLKNKDYTIFEKLRGKPESDYNELLQDSTNLGRRFMRERTSQNKLKKIRKGKGSAGSSSSDRNSIEPETSKSAGSDTEQRRNVAFIGMLVIFMTLFIAGACYMSFQFPVNFNFFTHFNSTGAGRYRVPPQVDQTMERIARIYDTQLHLNRLTGSQQWQASIDLLCIGVTFSLAVFVMTMISQTLRSRFPAFNPHSFIYKAVLTSTILTCYALGYTIGNFTSLGLPSMVYTVVEAVYEIRIDYRLLLLLVTISFT